MFHVEHAGSDPTECSTWNIGWFSHSDRRPHMFHVEHFGKFGVESEDGSPTPPVRFAPSVDGQTVSVPR